MNKLMFLLIGFIFLSCSHNNWDKNMQKHMRKVFDQSFATGDLNSTLFAGQSLMLSDTSNADFMDTMMNLYLQKKDFKSVYNVSKKLLSLEPKRMGALEAHASACNKLNLTQEAFDTWNKLYELEKNTRYLYEMMVLLFNAGNTAEGEKLAATIANTDRSRTDMFVYNIGGLQKVNIPILAQTYYFIGLLRQAQGQTDLAKDLLSKAIEIAPDFELAKSKLAAL